MFAGSKGRLTAGVRRYIAGVVLGGLLAGLLGPRGVLAAPSGISFDPIPARQSSELVLPKGFSYQILASQGDVLGDGQAFGDNVDFTAYLPIYGSKLGYLWVNHETKPGGGSVLIVGRHATGQWQVLSSRRFDFSQVGGTWNNCSGTVTPWGTILSAEEYEPRSADEIPDGLVKDPSLYGWMVEVDVRTGRAQKLYAMGRFSHENAAILPDKRTVFLTDDYRGGVFFKFVADRPGDLTSGRLYAADFQKRRWIPLPRDPQVLENARQWALEHGATPLDRPEDVEYNPLDGHLYLAITGDNRKEGLAKYGQILRIDPKTLKTKTFIPGGPETGLFQPDNLHIDRHGNLWIFEDKYDEFINARYGNNNVWVADRQGHLYRFASVPNGAEGTGPSFTPDGKNFFFSIQHPDAPWKDSVVVVRGPGF